MRTIARRLALPIVALAVAAACETAKSSNPLSPSVAGPIPGVNITPPKPLEPQPGSEVESTKQPLTLLVENASTNGERPINYLFEVASDAKFETKVYTREGVAPGADGRTSLKLPDPLSSDRTYYWRARAQDGANTGPYSSAVNFLIYTPIVLEAPMPTSPVGGQTISGQKTTFQFRNAAHSGPVGQIRYTIQVATNENFGSMTGQIEVSELPSQTQLAFDTLLPWATTFYWRVRSYELSKMTIGPWSAIQTFRTGAAPPPPPTTPPLTGAPCGNNDALIRYVASVYPDKTAPVGSLSQRQSNLAFLRDRIIEVGICCGMDLGWNMKRCGGDKSLDFFDQKLADGTVNGIDFAMDSDNYGEPLRLYWGDSGPAPGVICFQPYTPRPSCK